MTQTDRVLAALHEHRERGITAVDFIRHPTIDGGAPITRVAARVEELRDQGFLIESGERRDKCTVYRLKTSCRTGAPHGRGVTAQAPAGDTMTAGSPPSRPARETGVAAGDHAPPCGVGPEANRQPREETEGHSTAGRRDPDRDPTTGAQRATRSSSPGGEAPADAADPSGEPPALQDFELLADSLFTPARPRNAILGYEEAA